jgi:alpha-N-arabinofuranosidase
MKPMRPSWRSLLAAILVAVVLAATSGIAAASEPVRGVGAGSLDGGDQGAQDLPSPYRPGGELERRLDYLRAAIDHLHAAGLDEEADQVAEQMERWKREAAAESEEDAAGPRTFAVTIDAAKTGQPISKYIYGQFIEHQGRCIYGGIWAEMIRDRKFFYPVDYYFPWGEQKHKSPWRARQFDTAVVMDSANSFVGEHTPRIDLDGRKPRGIVQGGLGLRRGTEYEGHVVLAGEGSVQVQVSLVWGESHDERQTVVIDGLKSQYTTTTLRFTAGADTDQGRIEIVGRGEGSYRVGTVSLMPADNVHGMRADTILLLKQLGATVYRWPGGLFVNDYHWREATGDRDRRAPRLNRAYWSEDVESNDFGLDEFLTFCRALGAEPYVVVSSSGPNDDRMAAEEVEYANGSRETPMGRFRAANGHAEPYGVKFWGVGNEMWGYMPLADYIGQHNRIAEAMYRADPTVRLVAVGGVDNEGIRRGESSWARDMLIHCASRMDLISEHIYGGSSPSLIEHSRSIAQGVRRFVDAHRGYRERLESLRGRDVRLALDEWNYFWGDRPQIYGEAGPRYFFRDALGTAQALHEMFRNSDMIFMANTHPVNVHGQVKTTKTDAAMEATGLVLELYRQQFGSLPLTPSGDVGPLDVMAAWTGDRQALTVGIVNPTKHEHKLAITLHNAPRPETARLWLIAHSNPFAYNEPGQPPRVVIQEKPVHGITTELPVPPLSISLYRL